MNFSLSVCHGRERPGGHLSRRWRRHAGKMRDIGGVFFVFQAMPKLQEPAKILSQVQQGKVGLS
jgi:hypothetical protein